jgi:hypothetical protein
VAVKKWYWKNATASGSSHGSLSELAPTANTGALATGWTPGSSSSGYSLMLWGTRRAAATFGGTAQPASAPTTNDCARTTDGTGTGKYTGAFASGTWTLASTLSSAVASGSNVKLEFRLWRSVNADGSSATEITSGAIETNAFTAVDSGNNVVSATFNPGAVSLSGEYLFLQVACRINALGSGGATEDANISIFQMVGSTPGVAAITSPEFTPTGSEAIPKFQAAGTAQSGTGAVTPTWPTHLTNDIALLFVESANEVISLTTASGFVQVTNSPQGTGTGAGTTATRLAVYWCRATSNAMAAPVVADSGDHTIAQILTFRGCITSGDPWDVTAGDTAAASTTVTVPGATSTVADCLVVLAAANPVDSAADQSLKNWVNASLANIVEVASSNTTSGNGGGFSVATGELHAAGAYGSTTCTRLTSTVQGRMSIALKPPVSGFNGTLSATQADATLSSAGSVSVAGSLAATQADATLSAAGSVLVNGSLTTTADDGALSAAGSVRVAGDLSATADDASLSSTASVAVTGALSQQQDDATLSSTATVTPVITGGLAATQDDAVVSATASVQVTGALDQQLDDATLAAVGSTGSVIHGALSVTLDDAVLSSIATLGAAQPLHVSISVAPIERGSTALTVESLPGGRCQLAVEALRSPTVSIRTEPAAQGTSHISVEVVHE